MVSGGMYNGKKLSSIEVYSAASGWTEYSNGLPFASDQFGQASMGGSVYLFGGSEKPNIILKFDPITSKFVEFGKLKSMRVGASVQVINSEFYIIDGNRFTDNLTIEIFGLGTVFFSV